MSTKKEKTLKFVTSKRKALAILTAGAIGVGGVFGVQALAQSNAFQHMTTEIGYKGNWQRGGRTGLFELSDEEIEMKITRVVKHVAIEIDATDEQQDKIIALVVAVAKDMKPLREQMRASRDDMKALLLADTIDRVAIEQMRAQRFAEVDQISKDLANAVADIAEVLTLEQRQVLEERIRSFQRMMGGHRRGHHRN
ncbi:MAG: Spy/CpxP family protein refolding chaperone [Stappiaceae bacterium]